jgi:hypothetical protein
VKRLVATATGVSNRRLAAVQLVIRGAGYAKVPQESIDAALLVSRVEFIA